MSYLQYCNLFCIRLFQTDISFPSLEMGWNWKPKHQNVLFDDDVTTCINAGNNFTLNWQPLSLIIHWDPNEKNSPRDDAATYYCQPEFFVNVTHGVGVDVEIYKRDGIYSETNVIEAGFYYTKCVLIGQTPMQGLVRSKFKCHCVTKCHVLIRVLFDQTAATSDDRLCYLKVYD